ncbi:hypothetical protein MCUN1_003911 [Malassezia cuniculi]|uniref:Major facilitator superfamily (MFS) profile domain-containing protein n=1 Tax=Malassezia cuniculi TaxID=948313 RepID=A0AAF0J8M6_9BASI|nr:hypothetical protein MCUN1_003911 [Malassezia cuniculi]
MSHYTEAVVQKLTQEQQPESLSSDDSYSEKGISVSSHETWTPEEELRAVRKIDYTVLPLLTVGLFAFQLDRMNLSSALTAGLRNDIHVTQGDINLGNFLMYLGIIILEIPSNMLLVRHGPRLLIPFQILSFGLVATLQSHMVNRGGFLATRLILGLCEAGYIPGSLYILSMWYKGNELARRISILFCGMFSGFAFGPLIASGIVLLHGERNLGGWQWIFIIEGTFTIFIAIVLFIFLPNSPSDTKTFTGVSLVTFTERDSYIVRERILATGIAPASHISLKSMLSTLLYWKRWPHFLATALVFGTWSPLTTYTPTIFMSLGFVRWEANALTAVGGFGALCIVLLFGYLSDRTKMRAACVCVPTFLYMVVLVLLREIQPHVGKWGKYALWTVVNAFAVGYHPGQNTWLQLNCKTLEERAISVSMWVMSAMVGLMCSSMIFQGGDAAHYYPTGLLAMTAMVAAGLLVDFAQAGIYYLHNKRAGSNQGTGASTFLHVL